MQNCKFLAKNFDQVSNKLIAEADLLRLDVYISVSSYLEERRPCFIEVTEKYEEKSNTNNAKEEPIDLEKKVIKKKLNAKKRGMYGQYYL